MIESVLIFILVVFVVYYFRAENRIRKLAKDIPGPPGYPIVGNALSFIGKPSQIFKTLYQISCEYKSLAGIWLGPKFIIGLYDPHDVEIIFRDKRTMGKSDEYKFLKPWLGESILLSTGSKFRTTKKIMMPTFYTTGLKNHIELFNVHARRLVASLQSEVGKEEFDIQNYLFHTMLSELLETTLGVSHDTLDKESLIEYGKANTMLCKISHIRTYTLWLRFDLFFRWSSLSREQNKALSIVHPLCERVISRRKAEMLADKDKKNQETGEQGEESNKQRKAVLVDLLLNATKPDGSSLTESEIKDEVLTVMFAGQDTTSASIGFALSLLGIYQDVQDKVYEELKEIFEDSDRHATYDDLQKMEYLERVMQETWRLYPPVPCIGRKPTEDIPLASHNCTIPKGCSVAILTMLLHRNPNFYNNPHKFDPDNFLPENVKNRHPYAYVPFSGGIRTCIGAKYANLNIKILLSTLLRNYKVSSKRQEKDFKLVGETTLKRKEGFLIKLELRNTESTIRKDINEDKVDINMNHKKIVSFAT